MDQNKAKEVLGVLENKSATAEEKAEATKQAATEINAFTVEKARTTAVYYKKLVEEGLPDAVAVEFTKQYISDLFKKR